MRRLERLLLISPHCDDVVFACGQLLAAHPGATVVTVFAGRPTANISLPEWDRAAGFQPGDDVMGVRREEDRAALALLGAQPVWLEFCDSQYRCSPSAEDIARSVHEVLESFVPTSVFFPLGLFHSDHHLAHDASALLVRRRPDLIWFAYADALYRQIPGLVAQRLQECEAAGLRLRAASLVVSDDTERKRAAVHSYRSQLRALTAPGRPGYTDAFAAEMFWCLRGE
jgi:LmbE family N-acetylglucosaminyl deacetylase